MSDKIAFLEYEKLAWRIMDITVAECPNRAVFALEKQSLNQQPFRSYNLVNFNLAMTTLQLEEMLA